MMEGTAAVPPQSAAAPLPEAAAVFDAATAFDTALDMVAPPLTLGELLVRHVLLPRELLPPIEINSSIFSFLQGHDSDNRTWSARQSRSELLSTAAGQWSTTTLDGMWKKLLCQVTPSYARMLWQRTGLLQGVLHVSYPTLLLAPGSRAAQTAA
jgi:hypothetical protein